MSDDQTLPPERLLRLPEVSHRVGLGKTKIYAMVGMGCFPKPIKITATAVRWSEREINTWIAEQLRGEAT